MAKRDDTCERCLVRDKCCYRQCVASETAEECKMSVSSSGAVLSKVFVRKSGRIDFLIRLLPLAN